LIKFVRALIIILYLLELEYNVNVCIVAVHCPDIENAYLNLMRVLALIYQNQLEAIR